MNKEPLRTYYAKVESFTPMWKIMLVVSDRKNHKPRKPRLIENYVDMIAEIKVTGNHETGVETKPVTKATEVGKMPDRTKLHNPRLRHWMSTNVLSRSWKL
eukprot:3451174-Amphidinium_carterae.1